LTVGSYALVGSPGLPGQPLAQRAAQTDTNPDLSKLVLQVEKQLEKTPNDVRGWSVLGPALMRLRRFNDAADAFRKAAALAPGNADLQTSYGEALTLSEAGLVSASAQQAFTAALSINPKHPKARFYLAIAAYQDGRKTDAISLWKELLADSPPNAPWRRTVMTHIQRAEAAEGVQTAEGAKPAKGVQTAQANEARPPALDQETISNAEEMSEADQQEMIKGMVNRLADRLAENGDDLGGWLRLMRARMGLGQRDLATKALGDARASFEGDTASLERLNAFAKELGLETN
ncbi:MAG: tetratricopeptide repeat protein, partial [Pseudomonadota bacterium]